MFLVNDPNPKCHSTRILTDKTVKTLCLKPLECPIPSKHINVKDKPRIFIQQQRIINTKQPFTDPPG